MENSSPLLTKPGTATRATVSNLPSKLLRPEGTGNQRRNSMFNNLIESSSHAKEFKRRGSFLLFTTATYVVLILVTGVFSIYAYDAHLESQSTEWEIVTLTPFPPPEAAPPPVTRDNVRPTSVSNPSATQPVRTDFIDSASNPQNVPDKIGTVATTILPPTPGAILGPTNVYPPAPASGNGVPGGTGDRPVANFVDPPPPPAPAPPPVAPKTVRTSRVLNSEAISLPKPNYPPLALQVRIQGTVTVQVLIDEIGRVISAKAVAGHPLLIPAAERAARLARFSPTTISDQPVKVSGVITYNFEMR